MVYTGIETGIAQLIFPDKANGSIIEVDGKKYGCELLGQQYTDDEHKMCIRDRCIPTLPPITNTARQIRLIISVKKHWIR